MFRMTETDSSGVELGRTSGGFQHSKVRAGCTVAIWGLCRIRLIVAIRAKMVGAARIVGVDIKGPEKIISKCINKSIIHAKHRGVTGSINFKDHMGLHRII